VATDLGEMFADEVIRKSRPCGIVSFLYCRNPCGGDGAAGSGMEEADQVLLVRLMVGTVGGSMKRNGVGFRWGSKGGLRLGSECDFPETGSRIAGSL
jgi:hypothetical protein